MPTDISFPFEYDSGGGIKTVSGEDFYEQHALHLALIAIDEPLGEALTANRITEITATVENGLGNSPYFRSPRVQVADVDAQTESLELIIDPLRLSEFAITLTEQQREDI